MIEDINIPQVIVTGIAGGAGLVGAKFWFNYWIKRTDEKIDKLTEKVNQLIVSSALNKQANDQKDGRFIQLQQALDGLADRVAGANAKADKLWSTLEAHPSIVPRRMSDQDG